jgi:hypothetical protein
MIQLALLTLMLIVMGGAASSHTLLLTLGQRGREARTEYALQQARQGLLDFVASAHLNSSRDSPGDLPCPDKSDPDGPQAGLAGLACTQESARLGRLPFRKLGLPDLRDADGERIWYAVAADFVTASSANSAALRDFERHGELGWQGAGAHESHAISGHAVAVLLAPGAPRERDGVLQDRGCAACRVDPKQYLDATRDGADNARLVSFPVPPTWGFVDSRSVASGHSFNDRLVAITRADIMNAIAARVGSELASCVAGFHARNGRYPRPAPIDWPAARPNASESPAICSGVTEGRYTPALYFPKLYEAASHANLGRVPKNVLAGEASAADPRRCPALADGWWKTYAEHTFYALAPRHQGVAGASCEGQPLAVDCLAVRQSDGTWRAADFAMIVSGPALAGQSRPAHDRCDLPGSDAIQNARRTLANYLEGQNAVPGSRLFESGRTPAQNDRVVSVP